jgi:hypothetical protein
VTQLPGAKRRFWGLIVVGLRCAVLRMSIASVTDIFRPAEWVVHVLGARSGAAGAAGGSGVRLLADPALLCAKNRCWRGLALKRGLLPEAGRFRDLVWRLVALKLGTLLGVPTLIGTVKGITLADLDTPVEFGGCLMG